MNDRRVAAAVTAAGALAVVLLAAWLVPWHPVPWAPAPVGAEEVFSRAEIDRAEHYAAWARVWSWSGLVAGLVVAALLASSARRGRRLGRWLARRTDRAGWRAALAVLVVTLATLLAGLPTTLALWWLRRDVGLSTQGLGGVLGDVVRWQLVALVPTVLAVLAWRALVRRLPRAWPAVAALLAGGFALLASFVWPVLVEPMFNTFEPLPDGALRSEILAVADREGVPVDDVLVADASSRTTALNAYVSGYGSTRRVVLYDTLVDQEPRPVVVSVAAHELAHAKYDDPLVGSAIAAAGVVAGVGALGLVLSARRVRRDWGDPASGGAVVLALALASWATLLTSPVTSTLSRQVETRADVTAIESTGDPATFEEVQRALAVTNVSDPTPPAWSQWAFGSHPTTLQRIAIARGAQGR